MKFPTLVKTLFTVMPFCCSITLFSQGNSATGAFDFWVGEWEVSWYAADSSMVTGTNTVEKILDGKVLREDFTDPTGKFRGTSISVYNPQDSIWHQAWADNTGGYFNFIGEIDGERRIFKMTEENSQGVLYRMVFSDIARDRFTWTWEGTRDKGASWKTAWQIFYRRK